MYSNKKEIILLVPLYMEHSFIHWFIHSSNMAKLLFSVWLSARFWERKGNQSSQPQEGGKHRDKVATEQCPRCYRLVYKMPGSRPREVEYSL